MTAVDLPVLYSFRRCPYAMRARMAIHTADIQVRLREVVLRDKPPELSEASRKATVPVLVLMDNTVIDESLAIMMWALERNDPLSWLAPQGGSLSDVEHLIQALESDFKPHLDRYKYPNRYEGVDPLEHRAIAFGFLEDMAERLSDCPYLFGERPSLADVATFPFVRQFANTDVDWFGSAAPQALRNWLQHWIGTDLFAAIMSKYTKWERGAPEPLFPASV